MADRLVALTAAAPRLGVSTARQAERILRTEGIPIVETEGGMRYVWRSHLDLRDRVVAVTRSLPRGSVRV